MISLFTKFNKINRDYLFTDKHIHTNWIHAKNNVTEIIDRARQIGLNQIAITEHCRKESSFYRAFYEEVVQKRNDKTDIQIIIGNESKIYDYNGSLDISDEIKKLSEFKIGSVHNIPVDGKFYKPKILGKKICQDLELKLTKAALKNEDIDVIGHVGGQSLKYYGSFPMEYFEDIIMCCLKHDKAFDLNYTYHNKIINSLKPLLAKYNPYVSLGSDAHKLDYIGKWIEARDILL